MRPGDKPADAGIARNREGIAQRLGVSLRGFASAAALGVAAIGAGGTSALAQCTSTNNSSAIINYAPFANSSLVNSLVTTLNTVHLGSLAQSTAFVSSPANPKPDQQGAGSWHRVVGGSVETEGQSSAQIRSEIVASTNPALVGTVANGTVTCNTKAEQDFIATQFGFDIARFNFAGGGNIHLGLTGGYTDVRTKDKTLSTPLIAAGTYDADSQIPFAGVYASVYSGNISFDAQVRWDWIRSEINDPLLGLVKQQHDVRSTAFLWNAAYRFNLPNQWFVEPSIGGVWSVAEVDDLAVAGTFAGGNLNGTSPGSLRVEDVHSLLGRASVRVGTTIVSGGIALQPFVVGSVFREFAGNVRSSFDGDDTRLGVVPAGVDNLFAQTGTISSSRVGTYGHVGVGIAGVLLNTGWLGYARVDYRGGENLESITANAGLRYQFTPPKDFEGSLKDGGHVHADAYNWTGIYGGWHSGVVGGRTDFTFVGGGDTSPDPAGYLLGGQIGANYQIGALVLGAEADWAWSNAKGGQACPNDVFFNCKAEIENLSIIAGRLGYAWNRALVYAKAGVGMADVKAGYVGNGGPAVANLQNLVGNDHDSRWMTGFAWGAGLEFAFTKNWTGKVEYMRIDFERERFNTEFPFDMSLTTDIVRAGVNYQFGK